MRLRLSVFLILNFFTLGNCIAQALDFRQLTLRDGLPATECYYTMQDTRGYIWVFTEYGIVKHNGERFISVCTNIPLKDQNAYAVYQTEEGEIYFANSYCKIFKIRNDSAFSIKAIEEFSVRSNTVRDIIFQLAVDSAKNICFTNYSGSFCYSPVSNTITSLSQLAGESTCTLSFQQIEDSFFSTRSASVTEKIDSITLEIIDKTKKLKSKISFESFYEINQLRKVNDHYLLATSHFIHKINDKGLVCSKNIDWIINIFIDKQDKIWVLTKKGLLLLNDDLSVSHKYLEDKIVSSVCFDDKGGIWATTIGEGVFYCKNKEEQSFLNEHFKQKEVFFLRKTAGHLYLSSIDGSCCELDHNKSLTFLHTFDNTFYCGDIDFYKKGYLFSTKNGLFHKNEKGKITELKSREGLGLYSNFVASINPSEFLCMGGTGLYYFKNDSNLHQYVLPNKLYCFVPEGQNSFIIGTKKGLYLYDYKKNVLSPYNAIFADKSIMCLTYDPLGNLWVGTRGDGLYSITKQKKTIEHNQLPFVVVKDIDFFGTNGIVVSTNTGVYTNTLLEGAFSSEWINVFDSEVNASEVQDQTLWIASRKGLYSIDLDGIKRTDVYPVIISSIYANSEKVLEKNTELNYDQNDLRFNIDFLNYSSTVKNFFFKLEGPVELSGSISGTVLQVQNLDPGKYKLSIFPYNGPIYDEKYSTYKLFTIMPAFWQTYWFKIAAILLIVLTSGSVVGIYYSSKRKRALKEAEVNKLLAEYKLTALKAQINPHFISNSLSAIQLLIDSGKIDKANQYIAKFSLLIRYVLKYSDKILSRLSDELQIIELNVEIEQLRFKKSFDFEMKVDADINVMEVSIPPLITQPFIENAIWHGLLPLKEKRRPKLIYRVTKKGDIIVISIIDNGVGRSQAGNEQPISNNIHKESKGTVLIQNRIDNLNKLYNRNDASVTILDLHDAQACPAGTQIDITLPIFLIDN